MLALMTNTPLNFFLNEPVCELLAWLKSADRVNKELAKK